MYRNVAKKFKTVPTESSFLEKGTLTPQEFVIAGEQLVHRCPTWCWSTSTPGNEQKHLLPENQYLITRGVPCRKRVRNIEDSEVTEKEIEGGWIVAESNKVEENIEEIIIKGRDEVVQEDEEILDMEDVKESLVDENAVNIFSQDGYFKAEEPEDVIVRTRVYDLSVTYDLYYQTPRLWLVGYDENRNLLTPEQMYEDIMEDYAKKTATIETHPCLGTPQISIHPCNHAKMMKHFIDILASNNSVAQVHQAIFIFLKFLSSVVPTIEYDFTVDLSLE
ncbi:hypothetical protein SteCoe_7809 [Stentor coeruleus]|uniref:Uncharacterized protein n=1 Tax=Stentor coeruleus TaxID=5963 RepID=A0A1R2CLQ5_9CILI|nr:hypothetical protein SteCoe_7809 [Stentor coeruleus]